MKKHEVSLTLVSFFIGSLINYYLLGIPIDIVIICYLNITAGYFLGIWRSYKLNKQPN